MKNTGVFGIVASLLLASGCIIICNSCDDLPSKAENTVTVSREMGTNLLLDAQTSNGNISVQGQDITTCSVTAHITARARTQEEAQSLADGTQIVLELSDMGMTVDIKKPDSELAKHISISLDITMPGQNKLNLKTSNGSITLRPGENFSAKIDASTSNGKVISDRPITVQGELSKTSIRGTIGDGQGNCRLRTSNGSIRIH